MELNRLGLQRPTCLHVLSAGIKGVSQHTQLKLPLCFWDQHTNVVLVILELCKLASNSQRSSCLCFPRVGIKGMYSTIPDWNAFKLNQYAHFPILQMVDGKLPGSSVQLSPFYLHGHTSGLLLTAAQKCVGVLQKTLTHKDHRDRHCCKPQEVFYYSNMLGTFLSTQTRGETQNKERTQFLYLCKGQIWATGQLSYFHCYSK